MVAPPGEHPKAMVTAMTVTVKSDNTQLPDTSYTSMEWLNTAVSAWYLVAEHQVRNVTPFTDLYEIYCNCIVYIV